MSNLFIDMNDLNRLRFSHKAEFYCRDYEVPGPLAARALALQHICDTVAMNLKNMASRRQSPAEINLTLETLWHETEETVRRFAGESAGTTPQPKASEAPTSAQSDASSGTQASPSSTKPARIRSSLQPPVRTAVRSAAKEP